MTKVGKWDKAAVQLVSILIAKYRVFIMRNLFSRKRAAASIPPHSPNWVAEKRKSAKELADKFAYTAVEGEPLPPWIQYPEILIGSIGWRMGAAEDFIHEVFFPFWQSLTPTKQATYINKFDLGPHWQDREKWLSCLERNKKQPE